MAMNGQGSFWSAFGVRFGNSSSAIDEILEREGHTLEELLEHDDIIQECKYMNSSLIEYLSQKDVVEKLIKYVIAKPPELKTPDEKPAETKYPYVASELFACEVVSMLDVMFENQDLLELLFSFLDRKPPIDPSCAGYFRKVVVVLIQKKYEQLVKFIQGRGIVEKLVEHIGLYSIMELLIMIGWDDGLGQVNDVQWLYKEKLIPMLVSKLDPQYEKDEEVHVNAARALVDVVVKCPPSASSLLVTHLQSAPMLEKIFQYMLSGSLSSLNNCLSVVIVLVQRDANRRSEFPYDKIELGMPPVIELVQKNLATILSVLTKPPKPTELKTQFGSLNPPFGETRMKAVELLLVLFRSNYPKINEDLAKLKAIPPVLECFLAYPWNNMLHGLVESILRTVIDSDSEVLKKALFAESKLIDAFIRGHQLNNEACAKPKGNRLGYMGHLLRMCNAVVAAVEKDQQIKQFMGDDMKAWTEFVNGPLAKENERQQTVIGGHRPTSPFRQGDDAESQDPLGNSLDAQQQQYANSFPEANSNDDDDDDEDGRRLGYPGRSGQDFGNQPNDDDDDEDWANNVPVQFSPEWTPNFEQGQGAEQGGNAGAGQGAGDANGQGAGSAESGKKGAKKPGMFDDDDDDSDSDEDEFNPRNGAPSKKAEAKDGQSQAGDDGAAGSAESPKKDATPVKSDGPASVLPSDVLGSSPPAT